MSTSAPTTVAIVGAGFSGTLLALHMLRRCPPEIRVVLIERNSRFGRGQAFAAGNPHHLLNVPAGRMSAFHDRPRDFLEWLQELRPDDPPHAGSFMPRQLFGDYVRHLLNAEIKRPESDARLDLVRGDVRQLSGSPPCLVLDRERLVAADIVVLAVGNFPPEPVPIADPAFYDTPFYRPDPWAADALTDLDPDAPVLLIGTGLTMIDAVVSLLDQGHRGPIHAVSRRGLLPRRHPRDPAGVQDLPPLPRQLSNMTQLIHREARRAGQRWPAVIDALRPVTQSLWQDADGPTRARFLRHLRPWWDVHRHRVAPEVADRIDAARAAGQLCIAAGRIRTLQADGDAAEVGWRSRGTDALRSWRVARVVNCSGPGCDYDRIADPLIRQLLAEGLARPDPLRLGLDVTPRDAVVAADGTASDRLFAVGPVTRGAFWEITAVPDIRRQCEHLAAHLASLLAAR